MSRFSLLEVRSPRLHSILNATPTILVENGRFLYRRMKSARVTEHNIMESARRLHGIERADQIKFAILEANGDISIVPAIEQGSSEPAKPQPAQADLPA